MLKQIKQVMAEVFHLPAEQIPDDSRIDHLENWDSLGHIQLMLALEERFGTPITADDILHLTSLEQIARFLRRADTVPQETGQAGD